MHSSLSSLISGCEKIKVLTRGEAESILGVDLSLDQLEDLYDEKLFELKSFFNKWVPFSKLLSSKQKIYERYFNACTTMGYTLPQSQSHPKVHLESYGMLDAWNSFQKTRLQLKTKINGCTSHSDVFQLAKNELELYEKFANCFPKVDIINDEVKASQEFDPMDIQKAIKEFSAMGGDWTDILQLSKDNLLLLETKRLNLWLKLENGNT